MWCPERLQKLVTLSLFPSEESFLAVEFPFALSSAAWGMRQGKMKLYTFYFCALSQAFCSTMLLKFPNGLQSSLELVSSMDSCPIVIFVAGMEGGWALCCHHLGDVAPLFLCMPCDRLLKIEHQKPPKKQPPLPGLTDELHEGEDSPQPGSVKGYPNSLVYIAALKNLNLPESHPCCFWGAWVFYYILLPALSCPPRGSWSAVPCGCSHAQVPTTATHGFQPNVQTMLPFMPEHWVR